MPDNTLNDFSKLKELKQHSQKGDYWLLFYFGALEKKSSPDSYYRSLYLVKLEGKNYCNPIAWSKLNKFVQVSIKEQNTVSFILGDIFDWEGTRIRELNINHLNRKSVKGGWIGEDKIYTQNIALFNEINSYQGDVIDLFDKTYIPVEKFKTDLKESRIFKYPNYKSDRYTIIPSLLIAKSFYYHSSNCVNFILSNRLWEGFPEKTEDGIIKFDSQIIKYDDAEFLGQYFDVIENEYSAFRKLNESINTYHREIINKSKEENLPLKSDILYQFPFDFVLNVEIIGQYIGPNIFLAYDILSANPRNVKKKFHSNEDIKLEDINDKRSTDERDNKPRKPYKPQPKKKGENADNANDEPTDDSLGEDEIRGRSNFFIGKHPKAIILDRKDQKNKYEPEGSRPPKTIGGKSLNKDKKPGSGTQKSNITVDETIHIFKSAIKQIKDENSPLEMKYLIYGENNSAHPFSYAKKVKIDGRLIRIVKKFMIVSFSLDEKELCFVDSGEGISIGVFQNLGANFKEENDSRLNSFIYRMITTYYFIWSFSNDDNKNEELQNDFNVKLFNTLKHRDVTKVKPASEEETALTAEDKKEYETRTESLKRRMENRLKEAGLIDK
jgi:hypothetical protein